MSHYDEQREQEAAQPQPATEKPTKKPLTLEQRSRHSSLFALVLTLLALPFDWRLAFLGLLLISLKNAIVYALLALPKAGGKS